MSDNARTAQELADEIKRAMRASLMSNKVEVAQSANADRLAALASQAEPVGQVVRYRSDRFGHEEASVEWRDSVMRLPHGKHALYTTPPAPAQADAWQLLSDLVGALDRTHWSSWQATHVFQEQLDAARAALKESQR